MFPRPLSFASSVCLACLACLLVATAADVAGAQATRSQDEPYFALKLLLGVAGEAEIEAANVAASDDLEASFGASMAYMHPLHRYFVLGGQLSLRSWNTEGFDAANQDRSVLTELSIVPQGRVPLTDTVELYLSIPLGLALDFWGGDGFSFGGALGADVGTGVGFHLAAMFGARFRLSDDVGLMAELGYAFHSVAHSVDLTGIVNASADFDLTVGQPTLQLGVFF